jgi:hypothetical protein
MKARCLGSLIVASLCLAAFIPQARAADGEKISSVSPDGQFAMRISYDEESNKEFIADGQVDPDNIYSAAIHGVDLVAMPSKKVVTFLLGGEDNPYEGLTLIWSPDSQWFAFYSHFSRVGYVTVYHRSGDEFVEAAKTEDLQIDATKGLKGAVTHNEYVRPIRWTKPGVLVLRQFTIFRGDVDAVTYQLTAGVDPKSGKFKTLSKKKVPTKPEK